MKIPYGISNFKSLIEEQYLYIDKTQYIEKLEQHGKYNILLRPRRFGKSLFLSSLLYYYDRAYQDDFDTIFADLYIGRNPTPARNSYQVLFMEFSGIGVDDFETVRKAFLHEVKTDLRHFLRRYNYTDEDIQEVKAQETPADAMKSFFEICKGNKVYILIDEYDHFANAILGESLTQFKKIVGKGGFVRTFYETIKRATQEGIVDRLFITGVTAITLDSLTSGFNIGKNLTHHDHFNQAIGFTSAEVSQIIQPMVEECGLEQKSLMRQLGKWYNGYRFNIHADELIFNSDMILYFTDNFDLEACRYPMRMLDDNIVSDYRISDYRISDYRKIMQLFAIGDIESNYQVLEELIVSGEIIGLHGQKLDIDKSFTRNDFISLLLYMGFITIGGSMLNEIRYRVPNYVIQQLYFQYFKVEVELRGQITLDNSSLLAAVRELALHGNVNLLVQEITSAMTLFSNRDYMKMDEKHIKAVILTLLYQSEVYFIQSEPEINNRYPDILLLERNPVKVAYQFLFELKYSKKSKGKQGWQDKKAEGVKQVHEYLQLKDIQEMAQLKSYVLVTDGTDVESVEVEAAVG